MTETNFTPGPWEARYSSVIDVEKDEIIAVMTCGSVYRKNELEDYDTARFIAAAPRMYAALDMLMGANGPGDAAQLLAEERDNIIELLAKARGEA